MTDNARGRDVIDQILENMRSQTEELRYSCVVASAYNVHLHPVDFARLEGLVPQIVSQARRALDEELARLNRALPLESRVRELIRQPRRPYERASADWVIRILADPNEELTPGDILVDATLVTPESERYAGTRTQRIVTHRHEGHVERRMSFVESDRTPVTAATAATSASPSAPSPAVATVPALATLRWQDERGEHEFRMTSPTIKIGRGGQTYWVDLKLDALPDISREHVRIRFDEASKRFMIQDLSRFGTTVDGVAIPARPESPADAAAEELPLPERAVIGLAGVVTIRFAAEGAS